MSTTKIIATLSAAILWGCERHQISPPPPTVTTSPAPKATEAAAKTVTTMVGDWEDNDNMVLMRLSQDEQWKWWDVHGQGERPPEPPMLAGQWFVRRGVLYLRIDDTKEEPERIGPGLAFALEVKSVSPDTIVLHHPRENHDMNFRRVSELDGAANRSQPVSPQTNRPSAPAGSGR